MTKRPELKLENGRLQGFAEFDLWARNNNGMWRWATEEARAARLTSEDRIQFIAYTLGNVMSQMIENDIEKARKQAGGSLIFPVPAEWRPNEPRKTKKPFPKSK